MTKESCNQVMGTRTFRGSDWEILKLGVPGSELKPSSIGLSMFNMRGTQSVVHTTRARSDGRQRDAMVRVELNACWSMKEHQQGPDIHTSCLEFCGVLHSSILNPLHLNQLRVKKDSQGQLTCCALVRNSGWQVVASHLNYMLKHVKKSNGKTNN